MISDLRLTLKEWATFTEQCSCCKWWDNNEGCYCEAAADEYPIPDCLLFEEAQ